MATQVMLNSHAGCWAWLVLCACELFSLELVPAAMRKRAWATWLCSCSPSPLITLPMSADIQPLQRASAGDLTTWRDINTQAIVAASPPGSALLGLGSVGQVGVRYLDSALVDAGFATPTTGLLLQARAGDFRCSLCCCLPMTLQAAADRRKTHVVTVIQRARSAHCSPLLTNVCAQILCSWAFGYLLVRYVGAGSSGFSSGCWGKV